MKIRNFKSLILTGLFLLILATTYAQEDAIFQETTLDWMTPTQIDKFNVIQNQKYVSSIKPIEFGELATNQENGKIKIELPDNNCGELIYQVDDIEYLSEENYTWNGYLIGKDSCQCFEGKMMLFKEGVNLNAHITVDDEVYGIKSIGGGGSVIIKYDFDNVAIPICGVLNEEGTNNNIKPPSASTRNEEFCNVDVLVLYNASANLDGNINGTIGLSMHQTEIALQRSGISDCELKLFLLDAIEIDFDQSSTLGMEFDLAQITTDYADERVNLGADIVIFLTGDDYEVQLIDGSTIDVFGLAGTRFPETEEENMFCIVEADAATSGKYTFAHEIAHLFGAGHNDDSRSGIPHGHNFQTRHGLFNLCKQDRGTIMSNLADGKDQVLNYSNPDVEFWSKATGVDETNDNAEQIKNTACIVAEMQSGNQSNLAVAIDGPTSGCDGEPAGLEAVVCCAEAPYVYQWFVSEDGGITFEDITGPNNPESILWAFPPNVGFIDFIKLEVTSADGQVASDIHKLKTTCYDGYYGLISNDDNQIYVYPNPTKSDISIILNLTENSQGQLNIYDLSGNKVLQSQNREYSKGYNKVQVVLREEMYGIYFVSFESDKTIITKKITVIK
ncbi:MAG: zinc-dependent metalloprotease [Saprospiraceae bacterium]